MNKMNLPKREKKLKRKKGLRKMSLTRAQEYKIYRAKKSVFLALHNKCEAWACISMVISVDPECELAKKAIAAGFTNHQPDATEIHHRCCGKNRRATFLIEDTWMAVCRKWHNFITDNPALSYEYGLTLKTIPEHLK